MRLEPQDALARLELADHAVLTTVSAAHGVDAVPVCFALVDGLVAIPVDRVKPKGSERLQRVRNLEADPRATLLAERWDPDDWSHLWWVRARLVATDVDDDTCARLEAALRSRYPQYEGAVFDAIVTLRIEDVTGWSASLP